MFFPSIHHRGIYITSLPTMWHGLTYRQEDSWSQRVEIPTPYLLDTGYTSLPSLTWLPVHSRRTLDQEVFKAPSRLASRALNQRSEEAGLKVTRASVGEMPVILSNSFGVACEGVRGTITITLGIVRGS